MTKEKETKEESNISLVDKYLKEIMQLLAVIIILEILFNWDKILLFRDWLDSIL